jgi:hypothetical protein
MISPARLENMEGGKKTYTISEGKVIETDSFVKKKALQNSGIDPGDLQRHKALLQKQKKLGLF